jgi:zinc D-Ala-D-Ala dipeptidase
MAERQQDEAERRRYWAAQMDAAYEYMLAVEAYPVEECGERMASLPDAADAAGVHVLFSAEKHVKGCDRIYHLREGLIPAFVSAARAMNDRGWVLKVEDAYRTPFMQKHLALREGIFDAILRKVVWELGGETPPRDLFRRRLAALIAMNPKVGTHVSGSAMDISVRSRDDDREVDRGGPYPEMSERTPMDSPFVSEPARRNRREITALMAACGFRAYPWEFWHYNQGDAYAEHLDRSGRPARYGPVEFDPLTGRTAPIADATRPLNSEEDLEARIRQVMRE